MSGESDEESKELGDEGKVDVRTHFEPEAILEAAFPLERKTGIWWMKTRR